MKIALISANRERRPAPIYPIGLDYVAAAIPKGHTTRLFDYNVLSDAELTQALIGFSPDLIGLSLRNVDNTDGSHSQAFIADYATLIGLIRRSVSAPIVLGGSGFTLFAERLMQILDADYGIPGDGETIATLINALDTQSDTSTLPGVMSRGQGTFIPLNKQSITPATRSLNSDADHLPFYLSHGSMMNLQTKRGCPFHCVYCTYPYIDGQRLRKSDPDAVAEEALALERAGAKYFFITDSTFNCHVPHSLEVAKAFRRAGLSIQWSAFFSPLKVSDDYYKIMRDAGLSHVEFGTESLCDRVLSRYQKPFTKKEVLRSHQLAKEAGLYIAHYLMLGGPGEDADSIKETLETLDTLERSVFFFFCGARIYPHTPLYDIALSEGQISATDDLTEPVFYSGVATPDALEAQVMAHANGRPNWLAGGERKKLEALLERLYARKKVGPLWEYLIPEA